jgi:hypothetical protein
MTDFFKPYTGGKGTIIICFNDGKAVEGTIVKEEQGHLLISTDDAEAVGRIYYVPFPSPTIKFFYFKAQRPEK